MDYILVTILTFGAFIVVVKVINLLTEMAKEGRDPAISDSYRIDFYDKEFRTLYSAIFTEAVPHHQPLADITNVMTICDIPVGEIHFTKIN